MSDSSDELTSGQAENPRDRLSEVEEQLEHVQRGLSQLSDLEERVSQKHVELLNRFEESQANFEGSQGGIERPRLPTDEQSLRGFFATSFGSQGQSRWNADDQAFARLAFIFMVVHVAGGLVLTAFYYNFTAFEVYIMSLFWAMIVSIPLYQVKMTIIRVIFDRLLPDTFVVLQAHFSHVHHCKVLLRKLPRFYWLYMDQSAEKETESEESEQVSMVEAVVDRDVSEELQKGLAEGKLYHARVVAVPNQRKQRIEAYWEQRHWLGPFRPYGSIKEVFRDVPWLFHGFMSFLWFMLKPFHQFSNQADSAPYFGLLLRLCGLQLLYKLWTRELQLQLMSLAVITYIFVVFVRLAVWFVGFLAPLIWSKIPWSLRQALQKLQVLLKRILKGSVSKWLQAPWEKGVKSFEENCHFLLSMLIIIAAMLLTLNFMSFLIFSLRHEAEVIRSTCQQQLQKLEAYQSVLAEVNRASSDGGLFGNLRNQLEETLPDYEIMLARHIPDFYILKYVMYDLWTDEHAANDVPHRHGPTPEMAKACEEAVAAGAACHAEETIVMKHALKNTTAVLRGLAAGNLTDIASLLSGAYAEVSSISSLFKDGPAQSTAEALKDGAAFGGTLLAKLTYFLPRVLLDLLSSASCVLGQTVVFLTALFYLLSAEESCLAVVGEFLRVVDHKQVIFKITERVMRAVLVSAMKMSAFHALFTWLLYSFGQLPIVVVPTVLSAILALVPKVSPVWSVSFWAAVYLWLHSQKVCATLYFLLNLAVWWQVPTVIYAEIPEANAWLTGLGVVLGVGQFGLAGVVLGPLLASVPLICYNLVKLFNTLQWQQAATETPPAKRPSLFTLHEAFLHSPSPSVAAASERDKSSSSDSETSNPQLNRSLRRFREEASSHFSTSPRHSPRLRSAASPERFCEVETPLRRRNRIVKERVTFKNTES